MSEGRPSHLRLYTLLTLMVMLWASNFVVAKYVLREIPPLLTVGLRTTLAGIAMLPLYFAWKRRSGKQGWGRGDLPVLVLLGLIGVGLNQLLFVVGLAYTSVSHAAIIIGLSPLIVLAIAAASGMERMSAARIAGMLIALGGVAVLQKGASADRSSTPLGDLLVFLGSALFALYTVRGKAEVHRLGGVTINTFAYAGSAVALLPVTLWLSADFDYGKVSWAAWASLVYMAIFPSVVCYQIYYYALTHISASRVSAFAYLQPLIATLFAIPALGEYPDASLVAGGALVLAGVFMAERL